MSCDAPNRAAASRSAGRSDRRNPLDSMRGCWSQTSGQALGSRSSEVFRSLQPLNSTRLRRCAPGASSWAMLQSVLQRSGLPHAVSRSPWAGSTRVVAGADVEAAGRCRFVINGSFSWCRLLRKLTMVRGISVRRMGRNGQRPTSVVRRSRMACCPGLLQKHSC